MDALTSTLSNLKINKRLIPWPHAPSSSQQFSHPIPIIRYIAENPSTPKCYNKLIQTCKYFFEKHSILVAADIYGKSKICPNKKCSGNEKCCFKINLQKITSKIWLTNSLCYSLYKIPNFIPSLCSMIYRSDIVYLYFYDKDIIFEDFKMLTSCAKNVSLHLVQMSYSNGENVMLETIIEALPNIEEFSYQFKNSIMTIGANTLKNISKLPNLTNLKSLSLSGIPEMFTIPKLLDFIKKHENTKIRLGFSHTISDEYKNQLNALVDTVIESKNKCLILYNGQKVKKLNIMWDRFYKV